MYIKDKIPNVILKILVALIPLCLAILVLFFGYMPGESTNYILYLVTLSVLVIFLPWERLNSFKGPGIEIGLSDSNIEKIIKEYNIIENNKIDKNDKKKLSETFKEHKLEIEQSRNSRILWVDEKPKNVLPERRLLRALHIQTVMANTRESVNYYLNLDGDFDLIITDRKGLGHLLSENEKPSNSVLDDKLPPSKQKKQDNIRHKHIPKIPIIIYSAREQIVLENYIKDLPSENIYPLGKQGVEKLFEKIFIVISSQRPIKIVQGS